MNDLPQVFFHIVVMSGDVSYKDLQSLILIGNTKPAFYSKLLILHVKLLRAHVKLLRAHVKLLRANVKLLREHVKSITCTREVIP